MIQARGDCVEEEATINTCGGMAVADNHVDYLFMDLFAKHKILFGRVYEIVL